MRRHALIAVALVVTVRADLIAGLRRCKACTEVIYLLISRVCVCVCVLCLCEDATSYVRVRQEELAPFPEPTQSAPKACCRLRRDLPEQRPQQVVPACSCSAWLVGPWAACGKGEQR